ncbi:glycoside hydrolase family 3 C-terminal domain-containing protein [Microbacterium sp. 22303]|uniref:glycoside hydrolase family 3 C-terminal domain-containing protein n=1 Tax=Microbacterium sp. 22303 TaxID=3453905 RepID=UPI003F838028
MLNIDMGDVAAVVQLLAPYLIAVGVVLVLGLAALLLARRRPRPQRTLIRGGSTIAMVLGVVVVANMVAFGPMSTLIQLATGDGKVSKETTADAAVVAEDLAAEGIVLLQNDALLPLNDTKKVNLFGWSSTEPVYGGGGSGSINDLYPAVSIVDGLENNGIETNHKLQDFYTEYMAERPEMTIQKQTWAFPEPPADTYPDSLLSDAKDFSDVAVIVLARVASEGDTDMPTDMTKTDFQQNSSSYNDFEPGEHSLQISQTEQDMIDLVTSNFDDVVLVYNGANPMELGFVDQYPQIKSVLWSPPPGHVGFDALGKIIAGEINPSGRTADIFPRDLKQAPWWNNQVAREYDNLTALGVVDFDGRKMVPAFMNYSDGIYVGYRYYETAAAEGAIDYAAAVQYPFGHGLSYTTFTQQMSALTVADGKLTFTVTVTNTGAVPGKDVVEVYSNPPYTNGGIEKSSANLIAFDKTDELAPGASVELDFTIAAEDLASYDESGDGAYVLEAGEYKISINSDSHTVIDTQTYVATDTVRYDGDAGRASDDLTASNQFQNVEGDVTFLSRADQFANYSVATAAPQGSTLQEPWASEYVNNKNYDYKSDLNPDAEAPVTGANNGVEVSDLRGADFDDPRWEPLLDQLTVAEMVAVTSVAGYQTAAIDSVGLNSTIDSDGPAAVNNPFTNEGSLGFPVEVMIASTWNQDLAHRYGEIMGDLSRELNSAGWYAPGMNTHRVPFGARNFEYFSEDGVLAGKIAASAVQGAASKGVFAYIKHFALYDTKNFFVSIWSDEQATREIYLKPFEIAVKEGDATAVMSSWNYIGPRWAGASKSLLQTVLREEWGFRGFVLTDYTDASGNGFQNLDQALVNGGDAMLATVGGVPNGVHDDSAPTTVTELRRATKNIMYTVVNSWVHDGSVERQGLPPWQVVAIVINGVVVVALALGSIWTVRRSRKLRGAAQHQDLATP